jgi:hypothetical protein
MSEEILLNKTVFDKNTYGIVIDTQFRQLLNQNVEPETPEFTIEDFFQLYENLFNSIPDEDDINSHRYILQKEADHLGVSINPDDVNALLAEITSLRQQIVDSQQIIKDLTKK